MVEDDPARRLTGTADVSALMARRDLPLLKKLLPSGVTSRWFGAAVAKGTLTTTGQQLSEHVYWIFEGKVLEGKLSDLKSLIKEMVGSTSDNEPGTLNYEWTLSEDGSQISIYERFADSAAAMAHLESFGAKFAPRFVACLQRERFTVHGSPTGSALDALKSMDVKFMSPIGGFARHP